MNGDIDFDRIVPGTEICLPPRTLMCPNGVLYTVQVGDTFASIARRFGVSVLALVDQNPYTDPSTLRAGQILCIPVGGKIPIVPLAPMPLKQPCPEGYISGVVNYGQSVADILVHYDVSYQAFQLANQGLNPERLMPGQKYCVPMNPSPGLSEADGKSYVIKDGETLDSVAVNFGLSHGTLLRFNPTLAPKDFASGRRVCVDNR